MRRTLRRLTVGAAATSLALLLLPPAFAKGGVDLDLGDDGGSANVKVEVKDPGSGGGKSSGGGGSSSGGGKSSGGGSSSSGGSKSSGNSGKSSGGGGGGGTTSVSNSGRTSVGNYSSGSPSSVSSNRPDNVEVLDDGSRATYYPEGAYVQGQNGGPTAFVDGMTQGQPDPADPAAPAPAPPAQDPAPQEAGEAPAPQVDPAELAQTALSQMGLEAPEIASTPNDTETLGAVGLPVWFWVSNPGETTTGPNTTSASAGAVTVTATATFSGMSIDMGDGTAIECEGPGTEYPGTGIDPSPDCGHIYEQMSDDQPDGLYTVNITAHWGVEWESNTGESGTIPVELTTSKQLRIGQYQTVVTDVS